MPGAAGSVLRLGLNICMGEASFDGARMLFTFRANYNLLLLQFEYCNNLALDRLPRDLDIFVADVNVDFRAHAKFAGKINAGLDRETNAGCDAAGIARFKVIDVDAVPVHLFAD